MSTVPTPRRPSPRRPGKPQPPAASITRLRGETDEDAVMRPLDLAIIKRILSYTKPYAAKRNLLIVLVMMRSIQLPCLAWLIGAVINGPIAGRSASGAIWGAVAYLALATFTQATFHFRQRLALELGESVVHDLRREIFEHLQRMPMSFYHRTKLGRVISRITSDAEAVRVGIQDVLFVGIVGVGQMAVAAAFMLSTDWVLFCVVAAMGPVLWYLNACFRQQLSRAYRDVQESFSRLTATLAESVNGIRVTQGFARERVNADLFQDLAVSHADYNLEAARQAGILLPLLELNNQFFIAILLLLGGYRVLEPGGMPIGDLIQFFFLTNQFFSPLQMLGNQYNQALTAMAGAERVFHLLDLRPDWQDPDDALALGTLTGRVEFEQVGFAYEPGRPVLDDITFTAEPGQTIALVGHTGSGKSTISSLIAKFYLPGEGSLRIDGHDIRQVSTPSLRRQLGIVQQQTFLFSGTVLDNIRLGRPDATDDEVIAAVRRLECLDMLESLPGGLRTEVGERGAGLSLGQRQLVCFARAMLADPRILILDEATSSVDTLTELRLQQALTRLLAGRTSFVVAHRLSTIRHADLVLVIDHGQIVERGTHDQLVRRGGVYAELYEQFVRAAAA
ncbi:MAG: ABC transporter ATP-binding protein [Pirellulales bacterium]|nr:ABC transporter ATP-binding protein [Pirellulales bacterium]